MIAMRGGSSIVRSQAAEEEQVLMGSRSSAVASYTTLGEVAQQTGAQSREQKKSP